MREYQCYEFQAIDRSLTEREMATLRGFSSRATITPTRFVNNHSYVLLNAGRRLGLEPVTEPEEQRQPIIDGADLAWSKLAEDASHPPLVDGAQVVDEGVGHPGQSAVP